MVTTVYAETRLWISSGALLNYKVGNKKSSELSLFHEQLDTFKDNDIFKGIKRACSYYDIIALKIRNVDSVVTLARRIPETEKSAFKVLGKDDLLIRWKSPPKNKLTRYSEEERLAFPEELIMRQI